VLLIVKWENHCTGHKLYNNVWVVKCNTCWRCWNITNDEWECSLCLFTYIVLTWVHSRFLVGCCVARSLVFCFVFSRTLYFPSVFGHCIVWSILRFLITPLVPSNCSLYTHLLLLSYIVWSILPCLITPLVPSNCSLYTHLLLSSFNTKCFEFRNSQTKNA